MWSTLVGLIERWWREKPRLDLVRAVVQLRNAMKECQRWYDAYVTAKQQGDPEDISYPNPRVEWTRSLTYIGKAIVELDSVLAIFDAKAHEAIQSYVYMESLEAGAQGTLGEAAKALGQSMQIDIKRVEMDAHFQKALSDLDEFIRKNFKPEEVQAAQSSRWR